MCTWPIQFTYSETNPALQSNYTPIKMYHHKLFVDAIILFWIKELFLRNTHNVLRQPHESLALQNQLCALIPQDACYPRVPKRESSVDQGHGEL